MNKQFKVLTLIAAMGFCGAANVALAFGELDGGVGGACTTFTTCTATAYSHSWAGAVYEFNNLHYNYQLPPNMTAYNGDQDEAGLETTASVRAVVGEIPINSYSSNPFLSYAMAQAQSDFGVNRARSFTSLGVLGNDVQANGGTAEVRVTTTSVANSVWRDAWTFNSDGHFSATISSDGHSSMLNTYLAFPSTFTYSPLGFPSEWQYDIKVWDVDHLMPDSDHILAPTLVGAASLLETIAWNESRPSFASVLNLDFDFTSGVQYVAIAELRVNARNGRDIDLYNTARLTDVTLSNGATLSALSGHNYVSSVPVPAAVWLFGSGLLGLIGVARRKARTA